MKEAPGRGIGRYGTRSSLPKPQDSLTRDRVHALTGPIIALDAVQAGRVMDGSKDPVEEIGKVLRKHVDRATLQKVIEDL